MYDPESERGKQLDLVLAVATEHSNRTVQEKTLKSLALEWEVVLSEEQERALASLPTIKDGAVGDTLVAIEVKACMTQHQKAFPRLLDELTASHSTIHGDSPAALAAGLAIVNAGETFISSGRNKGQVSTGEFEVTQHRQPQDAANALRKLERVRQRTSPGGAGFDAFAVVMLDMANDQTPVDVVRQSPAPSPDSRLFYDQMIWQLDKRYEESFSDLG